MRKVVAVQDSDSHWYIIPQELHYKFKALLESDEDEFIETFSEYMTGGDLNNIQLYAEI